jgi:hypothetical protein
MDYEIIENTHTYTYNISQRIASIRYGIILYESVLYWKPVLDETPQVCIVLETRIGRNAAYITLYNNLLMLYTLPWSRFELTTSVVIIVNQAAIQSRPRRPLFPYCNIINFIVIFSSLFCLLAEDKTQWVTSLT